jgi:hypothetical protein
VKKKILVAAFALLFLAVLAIPVMAEKPTITSIKAVQTGGVSPADKMWTTNGNVSQSRGFMNNGTVKLYIPDSSSSPAYLFNLSSVFDATTNTKQPQVRMRVDAEWILYDEDENILGTFKGELLYHGSTIPTAEVHGVLQGTGVFKGQTLKLERAVGVSPLTWVGTLIER